MELEYLKYYHRQLIDSLRGNLQSDENVDVLETIYKVEHEINNHPQRTFRDRSIIFKA